jgi:hypothetical protein
MGGVQGKGAEFIAALQEMAAELSAIRDRLHEARISDAALGKLFEARAVRDAYHARLPLIERDLDQACGVVGHIMAVSGSSPVDTAGSSAPDASAPGPFRDPTGPGAS